MLKRHFSKYSFELLYAIYIIAFLDSLLKTPLFLFNFRIEFFYLGFLILLWVLTKLQKGKSKILKVRRSEGFQVFWIFGLIFMYSLSMLSPQAEMTEWESLVLFLLVVLFTVHFCSYFNCLRALINIPYILGLSFLVFQFVDRGMPIYRFTNISSIFFTQNGLRLREDFNFYHVNACGNLVYILLILSFFILFFIKCSEFHKFACYFLVALSDVFLINTLMLTNSRNSITGVMTFILVTLYYCISNSRKLNSKIRFFLKLIIVIAAVTVVIFNLATIYNLFFISNRLFNFSRNLPLLNTSWKKLFGLGMINPGQYGAQSIWSSSYYVDNYYIYILLDFGISGVIVIGTFLVLLGKGLHRNIKFLNNSEISIFAFALFVSQLVLGMGETCVIYPLFISSFMFLLISLSCYSIKNIKNCCNNGC